MAYKVIWLHILPPNSSYIWFRTPSCHFLTFWISVTFLSCWLFPLIRGSLTCRTRLRMGNWNQVRIRVPVPVHILRVGDPGLVYGFFPWTGIKWSLDRIRQRLGIPDLIITASTSQKRRIGETQQSKRNAEEALTMCPCLTSWGVRMRWIERCNDWNCWPQQWLIILKKTTFIYTFP